MGFNIVTVRDELNKVVEVLPEILPSYEDYATGRYNYKGSMMNVVVPSTIKGFEGHEFSPDKAKEYVLELLNRKMEELMQ